MKVLIFAYACEPNRGSEPGLGWNVSGEIARRHEVTLVTRTNNRTIIEEYLRDHPESAQCNIHFEYFDTRGVVFRLKKCIPLGTQLYFSNWLKAAVNKYKRSFKEFDIVHQLTFSPFFVRPWGASYTSKYVWGPVGGGGGKDARMGLAFLKHEPLDVVFTEALYRTISWIINSSVFGCGFRSVRSKVKAVLFKARAFSVDYVSGVGQIVRITRETGYAGEFVRHKYEENKHPLRVIMVGRMIPFKAFSYGIKAFARFIDHGGDGTLTLFGDGPLRHSLEQLSQKLGMEARIFFRGNVPNNEVHDALDMSDVYFHPSFIEATAWSIIEAMIHGVPVLCQNRSGMADVVTPDCGTLVSAQTPEKLISDFAVALMAYHSNPEKISVQGLAGQERVKEFYSWNMIGQQFEEVYHAVRN